MASKQCDSCKSARATLYCRADAAFLCGACDGEVHAANKVASRHARVWVCEVCEQAPAHVTCKADAAALCVTCDQDIHSANDLARRHLRLPISPIFDPPSADEAEAASWLLPNPNAKPFSPDLNCSFSDPDPPFLDLDLDYNPKLETNDHQLVSDGVVPDVHRNIPISADSCFDLDFSSSNSKPFLYSFNNAHPLTPTMSSSSLDVGVVPDGGAAADSVAKQAVPMSAADRELRVLRYREKRKNRKFEKTIRYASRKAYAETRPRIKGRFAKRNEVELEVDRISGYGVVPTF